MNANVRSVLVGLAVFLILWTVTSNQRQQQQQKEDADPKKKDAHLNMHDGLITSCELHPPELVRRIQKDLSSFGQLNPILKDGKAFHEFEHCSLFVRIVDNELYIVHDRGNIQSRRQSLLFMLYDMLQIYKVPNVEFCITIGDYAHGTSEVPMFAFSKNNDNNVVVLIPDFTFAVWPEARLKYYTWQMARIRESADQHPWESRIGHAYFRGAPTGSGRKEFGEMVKPYPEFEVNTDEWWGQGPDKFVPLEELCKYKYLIHMEGNNAYSSRIKYIMACNSTAFFVTQTGNTPPDRLEFWYDLLNPMVNYVPSNFENAREKLRWMIEHDDETRQIAARGAELARTVLSKRNVLCYWQQLLIEYKKHMTWDPKVDDTLQDHFTNLALPH